MSTASVRLVFLFHIIHTDLVQDMLGNVKQPSQKQSTVSKR